MYRRSFIGHMTAIAVGAAAPGSLAAGARFEDFPFALGVASGSPAVDGCVLWTRLVGRRVSELGPVVVRWEVTEEKHGLTVVTVQGQAVAIPELAHSVHIEVS